MGLIILSNFLALIVALASWYREEERGVTLNWIGIFSFLGLLFLFLLIEPPESRTQETLLYVTPVLIIGAGFFLGHYKRRRGEDNPTS